MSDRPPESHGGDWESDLAASLGSSALNAAPSSRAEELHADSTNDMSHTNTTQPHHTTLPTHPHQQQQQPPHQSRLPPLLASSGSSSRLPPLQAPTSGSQQQQHQHQQQLTGQALPAQPASSSPLVRGLPQPLPSPPAAMLRSPSPDSDNETPFSPAAADEGGPSHLHAHSGTGGGAQPHGAPSTAHLHGGAHNHGHPSSSHPQHPHGHHPGQQHHHAATPSSSSSSSSATAASEPSSSSSSAHPSHHPHSHPHPHHHAHHEVAPPTPTAAQERQAPLRLHPPKQLNKSPPWEEPRPGESTITVWTGTWNLHAKAFPSNLSEWIAPAGDFDLYAVGTEECENTIEASLIWSSKAKWTACVKALLGSGYVEVAQHTLQAIHLVVFIRAALYPYVHQIETDAVATGIGDVMGNKGGVGVAFDVSSTSFLFVNAHFAAHQHKVYQRNADYHAINRKLALGLHRHQKTTTTGAATGSSVASPAAHAHVCDRFDRVWWLGDLNYRIGGNRSMVDALVAERMIEVMLANDQLNLARAAGDVFRGFVEGEIAFMPTYKFDPESDTYDTSKKRRIPSYTDRILWRPSANIALLTYESIASVRTSDHRPVSATFKVKVKQIQEHESRRLRKMCDQSGSKACAVM